MSSINRADIVAQIAEKTGLTKADADRALGAFQDILVNSVKEGTQVKLTGFLTVERVERAARKGRNPRTGEEIQIPAGFGVKVSAGSSLKKAAQA
ncbi:MAG: HU family DNA-binding protein [Actinomycetaceae bacterium]|nr:HU family DNA-binding protein [Actinomycetaceae bacterium]